MHFALRKMTSHLDNVCHLMLFGIISFVTHAYCKVMSALVIKVE